MTDNGGITSEELAREDAPWTDELDRVYAEAQGVVSWLTEEIEKDERAFEEMMGFGTSFAPTAEKFRERASHFQQAREQIQFWAGLTD